ETDQVARGGGAEAGLLAGDVEVREGVVDGGAAQGGPVDHAAAVVGLRPQNLQGGVGDAVLDGGVWLAVVVRVLVGKRGNEEGAEELAGQVLREADAGVAAPTGNAGTVSGVGVGGDGDGRFTADGEKVERIEQVVRGKPGFLPRSERLDVRSVQKARIPIDDGEVRHADGGDDGG